MERIMDIRSRLERRRILPVFGMNLGTVGFLMNEWRDKRLDERIPLPRVLERIAQRVERREVGRVDRLRGAEARFRALKEVRRERAAVIVAIGLE